MADLDLKKYIPLKEIDLGSLPKMPEMDYFSLRAVIDRGVRNAIKPWQIAAELPAEISDYQLQGVYDVMIQENVDAIMTVITNEYLLL